MLSHVLESLLEIDVEAVYIVVGHKGELVQEHVEEFFPTDKIRFVTQEEQKGTAHAVTQTEPWLKDFTGDVIVCCGDAPLIRPSTIRELIETTHETGSKAAILSAIVDNPAGYGRIIRHADGVVHIVEHKDCNADELNISEVNAGTYCFDGRLLFKALALVDNNNSQKEYYLPDAPKVMAAGGHKVIAVKLDDWQEMIGINSKIHLAKANTILQRRIQDEHMINGVTIVNPEAAYIEKHVRIGSDTILQPFTTLRGKTQIGSNCEIGPFVDLLDADIEDGKTIGGGNDDM
jgi:bifunctional UDP-N-acetylglucosamine pyrophosphorylase/glucosamine-1-phosphate N-acetyltransferase